MARGFKLDENGDIIVSSNGKISFVAGKELKLESNKTIFATDFIAGDPFAIAIEQFAVFIAKMSLIPSPVMATV